MCLPVPFSPKILDITFHPAYNTMHAQDLIDMRNIAFNIFVRAYFLCGRIGAERGKLLE